VLAGPASLSLKPSSEAEKLSTRLDAEKLSPDAEKLKRPLLNSSGEKSMLLMRLDRRSSGCVTASVESALLCLERTEPRWLGGSSRLGRLPNRRNSSSASADRRRLPVIDSLGVRSALPRLLLPVIGCLEGRSARPRSVLDCQGVRSTLPRLLLPAIDCLEGRSALPRFVLTAVGCVGNGIAGGINATSTSDSVGVADSVGGGAGLGGGGAESGDGTVVGPAASSEIRRDCRVHVQPPSIELCADGCVGL